MKEYLYEVCIKDKKTNQKINLRVWAKNTDEATWKVVEPLVGYNKEYIWTGSGPIYENNKLIERECL
jgi:hypothetical protein